MNILEVSHLVKKFGSFTAVNDVSFSLKEGEILGFLGPNGAGKTTTIQMLLGILTKTSGDIRYFGKELAKHRSEILEQVNFSTTYTNLPWSLSVEENLTFISYLYTIPNRKKRVQEVAEIFKLKDLMKMRMYEASAGQITRINLAKAFLNNPKVLLLDEPTASLDPDVAQYVREFLVEERKKSDLSIIFTSHNMSEVEELCDRVIFINHGEIVANDSPSKLARTIDVTHVELLMIDGMKRTVEYCQKNSLPYVQKLKSIVIDVKEHEISQLLKGLSDFGASYEEISIEKPNLEDYFLKMSQTKNLSSKTK